MSHQRFYVRQCLMHRMLGLFMSSKPKCLYPSRPFVQHPFFCPVSRTNLTISPKEVEVCILSEFFLTDKHVHAHTDGQSCRAEKLSSPHTWTSTPWLLRPLGELSKLLSCWLCMKWKIEREREQCPRKVVRPTIARRGDCHSYILL